MTAVGDGHGAGEPRSARDEALRVIEADPSLRDLRERVGGELDRADRYDPGHDLEHCLRVAGWTLRCGRGRLEPREAVAAALLHDLVNVPKDDPRRAEASSMSAAAARRLLPGHGFEADAVERIAEAIEDHSFSRGAHPRSALGAALQDADRLEALGALGLMRTLSTGARMEARYFHPADPWSRERPLEDRRYSVDHFFTKLLRLPDTLLTEPGRAEARRRAAFLDAFLDQLADELGRPRLAAPSSER